MINNVCVCTKYHAKLRTPIWSCNENIQIQYTLKETPFNPFGAETILFPGQIVLTWFNRKYGIRVRNYFHVFYGTDSSDDHLCRWYLRKHPRWPLHATIRTRECVNLIPTISGGWINMKMPFYPHRKSHCGDKTILRPSYLHNCISYTGKTTSLYWIGAQIAACSVIQNNLNIH